MSDLTTVDEIAVDIINGLAVEDRLLFTAFARDEMLRFHFTAGMSIRNKYGLWKADCPLTTTGAHPDDVSMEILYAVWDKLHEEKQA